MLVLFIVLLILTCTKKVWTTIDVNLAEYEYLAAHLDPFECRRLVAALHYTSYELPSNIDAAERKVDEGIPCLRQLLHWNSAVSEGKGGTHEQIERRLRQLNRNDLADWLGKTVFKELGKDLERLMTSPFGELGQTETDVSVPFTLEPLEAPEEDDPWLPIDTFLTALLVGLIAILLVFMCVIICQRIRLRRREKKYRLLQEEEDA